MTASTFTQLEQALDSGSRITVALRGGDTFYGQLFRQLPGPNPGPDGVVFYLQTTHGEEPFTAADVVALARPVAQAHSPDGAAYRGRAGCRNPRCSNDGNPERCYGWHCVFCDGLANMQGSCSNPECPAKAPR